MGVAIADAGTRACHNWRPDSVSKARKVLSAVAPMKMSPLAVVIEPPSVGVPQPMGRGMGASSRTVPSGTCHRILPVLAWTAASVPQGGGLHGNPHGESNDLRRMT